MTDIKLTPTRMEALKVVAHGETHWTTGWGSSSSGYTSWKGSTPRGFSQAVAWLIDNKLAVSMSVDHNYKKVRLTDAGIALLPDGADKVAALEHRFQIVTELVEQAEAAAAEAEKNLKDAQEALRARRAVAFRVATDLSRARQAVAL